MKKFLSFFAAALVILSLAVPALAEETATIYRIDPSVVKPLELTLVGREITPHGRVDIYSFSIPDRGKYYEVPDFRGEYTDGAKITMEGTWNPSFATLNVMIEDTQNSGAVYTYVDCNEPTTLQLWADSAWACFLKAEQDNVTGMLQVEVS